MQEGLDVPAGTPFAAVVRRLEERAQLPPLAPRQPWSDEVRQQIEGLTPETMFGSATIANPHDAMAALSGLFLWNDCLDLSHRLSQGIETQTGSYWHGIMHRREPDYSNSKYWFRRVGEHPLFPQVRAAAIEILGNAGHGYRWATETTAMMEQKPAWDPFAFVDWCEACENGTLSPQSRAVLEEIQLAEIRLLLGHCIASALGSGH
jgi:hypothetical protein